MKVSVHVRRGDIQSLNAGLRAMAETVQNAGQGEVTVGRRKKLPHERKRKGQPGRKALHARAILNFIEQWGYFYFDVPDSDLVELQEALAEEVREAMDDAFKMGRPQTDRVKRALGLNGGGLAGSIAELVRERVEGGKLSKENSPKYAEKKRALAERGVFTDEYGPTPPPGIASGRTVKSLGARWKLGRRRR